ncbi:MAG: hypothetical protein NC241_11105 [Bacteroides sp.]|nr:hypothetical protein [Bacteroides sp.]
MIRSFLIPMVRIFQSWGYEVHLVGGGASFVDEDIADRVISLPLTRSPYTLANIRGYKQLRRLIETERYVLVDCHSPVGGFIGRLAARYARANFGTKVSCSTARSKPFPASTVACSTYDTLKNTLFTQFLDGDFLRELPRMNH